MDWFSGALKRRLTARSFGTLAILALALGLVGALTSAGQAAGVTRTYFIAADEVEWDYAPSNSNQITGLPFGDTENVFVQNGPLRIGDTYIKALYREYTSDSFATPKVDPKGQHLGVLGPVIRAVVGDTIVVNFKNNTRFPVSVHPHGVFYLKNSEGAPYADGTSGANKNDDAVAPNGGTHKYTWIVPERAGPGPMDPSSIVWAYHSHTDEVRDTNGGLVGPIIITKAGMAKADGSPKDVDREFVNLFTVFDENNTNYLEANIQRFAGTPNKVNSDDDGFIESNLMHSINGFVYGNMPDPGLAMNAGERVRWYMIGMGTEVDLHTPHWHANTLLWGGMRTDMTELLPMSMKTLDMKPDNPGEWLYHCHVNDHLDAGMVTTYTVN